MKARKMTLRALLVVLVLAASAVMPSKAQANVTAQQVTTALSQATFAGKVQALAALVPLAQGQMIDANIQNAYGTALVQLFSQHSAQGANAQMAFKGLLGSASASPLLNAAQQEYVRNQMLPKLATTAAPAVAAVVVQDNDEQEEVATGGITSAAIQQATSNTDVSQQIQSLYGLMQQSQGQQVGADVQSSFASALVATFNQARQTQDLIFQLLNEATQTSLLNAQQQHYVAQEMIPALDVDAPDVVAPAAPVVAQVPQTVTQDVIPTATASAGVIPTATASNEIPMETATTQQVPTTIPVAGQEQEDTAIPMETTGTKKGKKKRLAKLRKRLKKLRKRLKKAKGKKRKTLKKKIKKLKKKIKKLKKKKKKKKKRKKKKKKKKKKRKKKKRKKKKRKKRKKRKKKKRKKRKKKKRKKRKIISRTLYAGWHCHPALLFGLFRTYLKTSINTIFIRNRLMKDDSVTLEKLKTLVKNFRDERDWAKYHNPKDLATALSVEAGELLALFTWQGQDAVARKLDDAKFTQNIKDELADVLMCCLSMANTLNLDIATIVAEKTAKTSLKYPADKVKGDLEYYAKVKLGKIKS